jgi:hypothetical protein
LIDVLVFILMLNGLWLIAVFVPQVAARLPIAHHSWFGIAFDSVGLGSWA